MNTLSAVKLFNCADGVPWDSNSPTGMSPFSIHYILVLCEASCACHSGHSGGGELSNACSRPWPLPVLFYIHITYSLSGLSSSCRGICWLQLETDSKDLTSFRMKVQCCIAPREKGMLSQQRVNSAIIDNDKEKGNVAVVGGPTGQTAAACKALLTNSNSLKTTSQVATWNIWMLSRV